MGDPHEVDQIVQVLGVEAGAVGVADANRAGATGVEEDPNRVVSVRGELAERVADALGVVDVGGEHAVLVAAILAGIEVDIVDAHRHERLTGRLVEELGDAVRMPMRGMSGRGSVVVVTGAVVGVVVPTVAVLVLASPPEPPHAPRASRRASPIVNSVRGIMASSLADSGRRHPPVGRSRRVRGAGSLRL